MATIKNMTQKKEKKHVSFAPKVQTIRFRRRKVHHDQSPSKSLWYSDDDDKDSIKEYLSHVSRYESEMIDSGSLPVNLNKKKKLQKRRSTQSKEDDDNSKKLEFRRNYLCRKARHLLFKEQHRQIQVDIVDPDQLAKVYSQITQESIEMARTVATEKQVGGIVGSASSSSSSSSQKEKVGGGVSSSSSSSSGVVELSPTTKERNSRNKRHKKQSIHYSNSFGSSDTSEKCTMLIPCI